MASLQNTFSSSAPVREKHEVMTQTDSKTGIITYEEWFKDGKADRTGGPAWTERDPVTGITIYEVWVKDGKPHRADGPAVIVRDPATGDVTDEVWFKDGKKIAPPSAAANPAQQPKYSQVLIDGMTEASRKTWENSPNNEAYIRFSEAMSREMPPGKAAALRAKYLEPYLKSEM